MPEKYSGGFASRDSSASDIHDTLTSLKINLNTKRKKERKRKASILFFYVSRLYIFNATLVFTYTTPTVGNIFKSKTAHTPKRQIQGSRYIPARWNTTRDRAGLEIENIKRTLLPSVTETPSGSIYRSGRMRNRRCPVTMIAFQFDGGNIPSRGAQTRTRALAWPPSLFSLDRCAHQYVRSTRNWVTCRGCPEIAITLGIIVTDYISSACVRLRARARETCERIAATPFATVLEARVNTP